MKRIFVIFALAATLVGCAKEDIVRIDRQAIAFGDTFVDNATRADYSTGSLTEFYVYGTVKGTAGTTVNIFDGDKVTKTQQNTTDIGGEGTWWYAAADAQYWIPKASYSFAAVVDATVNADATKGDLDIDTNGMPIKLHTQADADMHLKDMLYATATATVNADGTPSANPVAFTFAHLLSKAHFTVTSNAEGDYYHTVTGIKIANFKSGTYTINGGTWTASSDEGNKNEVAFADIANVTSTDTNGKSNAAMLLVPNAATFNVIFTVDLYKGTTKLGTETKTIPVTIKDAQDEVVGLQKGNSYNFTIACSVGNPIKFGVTNDPSWGDTTDVTIQ